MLSDFLSLVTDSPMTVLKQYHRVAFSVDHSARTEVVERKIVALSTLFYCITV